MGPPKSRAVRSQPDAKAAEQAASVGTPVQRHQDYLLAIVKGTHAAQILLHRKQPTADVAAFRSGASDGELTALADVLPRLVAVGDRATLDWIESGSDAPLPIVSGAPALSIKAAARLLCDATLPLATNLPLSVVRQFLRQKAPAASATACGVVASLYQMVMQVSLDVPVLQELFARYIALKLPVSLEELGLAHDRAAFLELARAVAPKCCACPFDVSVDAWHLASQKLNNWSERHRGKLNADVYARELLTTPEIRACVTGLRVLPPQKICVLGHSFTMSQHWASAGSFTDIAARIARHHNPGIEWVNLSRGNLNPTMARRDFLAQVIKLRADQILLVMLTESDEQRNDLRHIIRTLHENGARVLVFDCPMISRAIWERDGQPASKTARTAGAIVIEVFNLLDTHPQRAEFPALDEIHMTAAYHKFMAVQLVQFLAGRREAALPPPVAAAAR